MIESLAKALRELGATRVKDVRGHGCVLLVSEFGSEVYLISVSRGGLTSNYVVKIAPASRVGEWSCAEVEYSPYGLYVLGGNEDEVVSRAIGKLSALLRVDFSRFGAGS